MADNILDRIDTVESSLRDIATLLEGNPRLRQAGLLDRLDRIQTTLDSLMTRIDAMDVKHTTTNARVRALTGGLVLVLFLSVAALAALWGGLL